MLNFKIEIKLNIAPAKLNSICDLNNNICESGLTCVGGKCKSK